MRCQDCKNNCAGNCEKCLDNIHFGRDSRRYNCINIVNYYVCKYSYRYASEMEILLNVQPEIKQVDEFKILSIGCGPCTDLFSFESFINKNFLFTELQYVGVDLNKIWEPVHKKISRVADNYGIKTKFIYNDIFKIVEKIKVKHDTWVPNILSLQYVLSDMANYSNEEDILQFIDDIINKLIINLPDGAFIIINDINRGFNTRTDGVRYNTARYYYDIFLNKVLDVNRRSNFWQYHFNNNVRPKHFDYGTEHLNNDIVYDVPEMILKYYNPWLFCSSAQLLIRKEG